MLRDNKGHQIYNNPQKVKIRVEITMVLFIKIIMKAAIVQ